MEQEATRASLSYSLGVKEMEISAETTSSLPTARQKCPPVGLSVRLSGNVLMGVRDLAVECADPKTDPLEYFDRHEGPHVEDTAE